GEKEHMENFIKKGEMFFNSILYFKDKKINHDGRYDKKEGLSIILDPENTYITINNIKYSHKELFQYADITFNNNLYHLIYSLYSFSIPKTKNYPKEIVMDEKMYNFGEYFVFIKDIEEFLKRVKIKINKLNLISKNNLVLYEDFKSYNGYLNNFIKDKRYEYQKEYRILIKNYDENIKNKKIYIGNIEDIASIFKVNVKNLKITFN
ncbi:MAG: hypothetical protein PHE29_08255, partial [Tissierellia bacterium]|nr:hypothetical protein [Tissierellia bacterium]